jgi:hypothetical protein
VCKTGAKDIAEVGCSTTIFLRMVLDYFYCSGLMFNEINHLSLVRKDIHRFSHKICAELASSLAGLLSLAAKYS